jgi:natural product precursor
MKKLSKLKLNQLGKAEMDKREMQYLTGGCSNACSCAYAGPQCSSGDDYYGGSSRTDNGQANVDAMNSY